jgi:hypothetical protein
MVENLGSMGFAGLDIARLRKRLSRIGLSSSVVEDDAAKDHCVLQLCRNNSDEPIALLEYENQGDGIRFASLIRDTEGDPWEPLVMTGARRDDPEQIVEWLAQNGIP